MNARPSKIKLRMSSNRKYEDYYVKNPIIMIQYHTTYVCKINGEETIILDFSAFVVTNFYIIKTIMRDKKTKNMFCCFWRKPHVFFQHSFTGMFIANFRMTEMALLLIMVAPMFQSFRMVPLETLWSP